MEKAARESGRDLTVEFWSEFHLRELILKHDGSGGLRDYFFDQGALSSDWFQRHIRRAQKTAEPRYTPEVNVETPLLAWFSAFGRTEEWSESLQERIRRYRRVHDELGSVLEAKHAPWPGDTRSSIESAGGEVKKALSSIRRAQADSSDEFENALASLSDAIASLEAVEARLAKDLNDRHGEGRADSESWRQMSAELFCTFPAANLDAVRDSTRALTDLRAWLVSPECLLAFHSAFLLTGQAGTGKTHSVCDVARHRLTQGLHTCIVYGHEFGESPEPWVRIAETLGLPSVGVDRLLDSLNAVGEADGSPVLLCIDALNETKPLSYWRRRLQSILHGVADRAFIRICVVCRSTFLPYCVPADHGLPVFEHRGFADREWDACRVYFEHYGLQPPVFPILPSQFGNPLYLRLACSTLKEIGATKMPSGWSATSEVVRAFLDQKNHKYAVERELPVASGFVTKSLTAIVQTIATTGEIALPWSRAVEAIEKVPALADPDRMLTWCTREGLLIEDGAAGTGDAPEVTVRPAFERLGDYLLASEILRERSFETLRRDFTRGGVLHDWIRTELGFAESQGVLAALSVLLPEKWPNVELPLLEELSLRSSELALLTVSSLSERSPGTIGFQARRLAERVLASSRRSYDAMDVLIGISSRKSELDADWLHRFLQTNPMARRDQYWCSYLHHGFESATILVSFMDAALRRPLSDLGVDVAERWATVLLWFTASSDRRVKDRATRAALAVLTACKGALGPVLDKMVSVDDDEVRERALLVAYGTLLQCRDSEVVGSVTSALYEHFRANPEGFQNALLRDHIRCIGELAVRLGALPATFAAEEPSDPIDPTEWSPDLPSDEQVELWSDAVRFWPDEFRSDFFKYTMWRLEAWENTVPKTDMAKWILQRVARDFGYMDSECQGFDHFILQKYGGGRAKPDWAERIAKKYTWVAMAQLASRLHDRVPTTKERWEKEPAKRPLIFLHGRGLDPTLLPDSLKTSGATDDPWHNSSPNLDREDEPDDEAWVAKEDDIPSMDRLLAVGGAGRSSWHPLVAHLTWREPTEESDWSTPYRQVWIMASGFVVEERKLEWALKLIRGRNFFGRWMPEGALFSDGFAGEYPWATAFNLFPDAWFTSQRGERGLPEGLYRPSWNSLLAEYQYDTSFTNCEMMVPSRMFFEEGNLWWNGKDGYRVVDGDTVFRDPRLTSTRAPSALLVESGYLREWLTQRGLSLVWTFLGERRIIRGFGGGGDAPPPSRTFSQVGYLDQESAVRAGERFFFEDYQEKLGPDTSVLHGVEASTPVPEAGRSG